MRLSSPFRKTDDGAETGLFGFLVLFVVFIGVMPMTRLVFEGLAPGGVPGTDVIAEVMGNAGTWKAAGRSLYTAAGGTIISLALGGAFAILVAITDIRAKAALVFCFMIPMMIPPQITALSWVQLFGPSSAILQALGLAPPPGTPNPLYSPGGIILLLGIQHSPLVFLSLRAGLRNLPREMIEASRSCGAGQRMVMMTIILPLMAPALVAGTALSFVSAIGNFGIPAMIGIPFNYTTLPVLIYQRLSGFGPSIISEVAVLSILIGAMAFAGVLVQNRVLRHRDYRVVGAPSRSMAFELGRWRRPVEILCWAVITVILVIPLLALLATSLVPAWGVTLSLSTATIDAYVEVMLRQAATWRAFGNSFLLAGGAALALLVIAIPFGYFLTWKRSRLLNVLNLAAEMPYALPGVVLAIACILMFIRPLPFTDISIYGSLWIIFIAYLARFFTLILRPVVSGYAQFDRSLEEAGRMCGAGFIYRLRTIILPGILPVAIAGAILVFMTAFNELTVSALLWSSGTETLGVLVYNLDDGGDTVLATAVAVIAVTTILGLMSMAQLLSRRFPRGVLPWQE